VPKLARTGGVLALARAKAAVGSEVEDAEQGDSTTTDESLDSEEDDLGAAGVTEDASDASDEPPPPADRDAERMGDEVGVGSANTIETETVESEKDLEPAEGPASPPLTSAEQAAASSASEQEALAESSLSKGPSDEEERENENENENEEAESSRSEEPDDPTDVEMVYVGNVREGDAQPSVEVEASEAASTVGLDDSESAKTTTRAAEEVPTERDGTEDESEALHDQEYEAEATEEDDDSEPSEVGLLETVQLDASELRVQEVLRWVGGVPICSEDTFFPELEREISKCRRVDRPLALLLVRVADLPEIVEMFGTSFRERVLEHVAEQATSSLRDVDLVAVLSSKELIAMVVFAADSYGSDRVAGRIQEASERHPFHIGEALPAIVPALRFGVAVFPQDGADAEALEKRAIEQLGSSSA
jgi:diguanylate cyclase (GGDEF)-like protein